MSGPDLNMHGKPQLQASPLCFENMVMATQYEEGFTNVNSWIFLLLYPLWSLPIEV